MDEINSTEFLKRLQEGSLEAYEYLVGKLLTPLRRFLSHTMNLPEPDAEELADDVFLQVHRKIKEYKPGPAKLTTWIFQIAKNQAIDYYRKATSQPPVSHLDPAKLRTDDFQYARRNQQMLDWLLREMQKLSETDQHILLWRSRDIPYVQIAEWLGINETAARVRHKRATEKLLANGGEFR